VSGLLPELLSRARQSSQEGEKSQLGHHLESVADPDHQGAPGHGLPQLFSQSRLDLHGEHPSGGDVVPEGESTGEGQDPEIRELRPSVDQVGKVDPDRIRAGETKPVHEFDLGVDAVTGDDQDRNLAHGRVYPFP